ncbi:hypothetical protein [Rhodoblastus sp.]|uniref:hypothetical protein n=1 Tax=Rhodoblastus sp. TaxID=1962975 RepID=UPI003F9C1777
MKPGFLFVSVFCVALALSACGGQSASYRYKLTLSLDTPDGVKTGYNVVELNYFEVGIPMRGEPHTTRGQGIYIDLGPGRRPLIALLEHIRRANEGCKNFVCNFAPWNEDEPTFMIGRACGLHDDFMNKLHRVGLSAWLDLHCRQPITISTKDLPELVTFAGINDPKSVASVDPDNLAATLGPGVTWRSITIQTTDEPLTKGIDEHLPWVRGYKDNIPIPGIDSFQYKNSTFIYLQYFIKEH